LSDMSTIMIICWGLHSHAGTKGQIGGNLWNRFLLYN